MTMDEFVEEYDEELENNHDELMKSETSHYVLAFLFDLLQFFTQFFMEMNQPELSTEAYKFEFS
jgi:hypothetical protein